MTPSTNAGASASDSLGAGDSYMILDLLGEELSGIAFEKLRDEVEWNTMYHRGKPSRIKSILLL